ncbi:MAG: glycine cleavage system aminomethyltransferase GcvT [Candidatus Omnitrophota bacterium]
MPIILDNAGGCFIIRLPAMFKDNQNLKNTPLYERHVQLGAKMVPFSGWNMPVQYTGIIEEHLHTRAKAGLFDIFHMGEFFLRGPSCDEELEGLVTCRVSDMNNGRAKYGFILNENGGIVDDLIVFKLSSEEFMLVVNAGRSAKDKEWIKNHVSSKTDFADESAGTAKLDLQGPLSGEILSNLCGKTLVDGIKRYNFVYAEILGIKILLSRTGYTGELGYELFFPAKNTVQIWDTLLKSEDVKPIGLGARDTLRMEMGYPLYGNELNGERTPFEANLSKFVYMEKDFIGKQALLKQKEQGVKKCLVGFVCEARRSARSHFKVLAGGLSTCHSRESGNLNSKKNIGEVTSGAFSPCLKKGIGLCYIDKALAEQGREILLSDGKIEIKAEITGIPMYRR